MFLVNNDEKIRENSIGVEDVQRNQHAGFEEKLFDLFLRRLFKTNYFKQYSLSLHKKN